MRSAQASELGREGLVKGHSLRLWTASEHKNPRLAMQHLFSASPHWLYWGLIVLTGCPGML